MPDPRYAEWLPTPAEIRERAAVARWLRENGFHEDAWGLAIMVYECPHIDLVRRLVAKYGRAAARMRLEKYIEEYEVSYGRSSQDSNAAATVTGS